MDATRVSAVGKRGRGLLAAGLLALPASFCGAACGSQASDDYQGEVLLTIEGQVNVETSTDLELKLGFYTQYNTAVKVMDGHVSGEFPAKFRFEVTDPPPDGTLLDLEGELGMQGSLAVGFLVLLPPNAPSTIPELDRSSSETCDEGDICHIWDECPLTEEGDILNENCRNRKFSCSARACESYASDGDPELRESISLPSAYAECMFVPYCFSTSVFCSSPEDCYHEYYECDIGQVDRYDSFQYSDKMEPYIEDCELVEETGGPLFAIPDITSAGAGYLIFYLTEDNPDSPLGNLKQGYNVIAIGDVTHEQWQTSTSCLSYDPAAPFDESGFSCVADDARPWRVVEDRSLSIDLGAAPSLVAW
jgi:hypothetical protein